MTSRHDGSRSSLAAPLTQNTAPVIEFRCLFTHDPRKKKQKRWQDGLLRYHTFNKRLMTYEYPGGNFVGDSHWREDQPVQDGDEVELDRAVLVQVGEQIGELEQDLSELLNKRTKKIDIIEPSADRTRPSPVAPSTAASRISSSTALLPKSLNEVLGHSTARLGRSSLPTKSPYESRHVARPATYPNVEARPAKRQRIDGATTEEGQSSRATSPLRPLKAPQRPAAKAARSSGGRPQVTGPKPTKRARAPTTPTLISSDEEEEEVRVVSVLEKSVPQPNSLAITKRSGEASGKQKSKEAVGGKDIRPKTDSKSRIPEKPHDTAKSQSDKTKEPRQSSSAGSEKTGPRTKLQIAASKPRRKLMYKDLLPPKSTQKTSTKNTARSSTDVSARRELQSERRRRRALLSQDSSDGSETEASGTMIETEANLVPSPQAQASGLEDLSIRQPVEEWEPLGDPCHPKEPAHEELRMDAGRSPCQPASEGSCKDDSAVQSTKETAAESTKNSKTMLPEDYVTRDLQGGPRAALMEVPDSVPRLAPTPRRRQLSAVEMRPSRPPSLQTFTSMPDNPGRKTNKLSRGPLKNALSASAISAPQTTDPVTPAVPAAIAEPDPWSKEAWDLFGCWRNGETNYLAELSMNNAPA